MPSYRVTMAINKIPIHQQKAEEYHSTRLTAFLWAIPNKQMKDKLIDLLIKFTESCVGYISEELWFSLTVSYAYEIIEPSEARGVGFYYGELVFEDPKGKQLEKQKVNLHTRKFGDYF